MTTVNGVAIGASGLGYLRGCTIYADLNGDGKQDPDEPTTTTGPYGGWTLIVEASELTNAALVIPAAGAGQLSSCHDSSTSGNNITRNTATRGPAGCEVLSTLSDMKYATVKSKVAGGKSAEEANEEANIGLARFVATDQVDFDVCAYNPVAEVFTATASGSGRRLEEAVERSRVRQLHANADEEMRFWSHLHSG